ncbi:TPA: hypothetical protein ACWZHL_004748 [Escherichia coli]
MIQKLYVPYTEESASDWSPNCVVMYEDYAELERKLRNFADQVLNAPCSKVTEEMACEILGI